MQTGLDTTWTMIGCIDSIFTAYHVAGTGIEATIGRCGRKRTLHIWGDRWEIDQLCEFLQIYRDQNKRNATHLVLPKARSLFFCGAAISIGVELLSGHLKVRGSIS